MKLTVILLVVFVSGVAVAGKNFACCPAGQYITNSNETDEVRCEHLKTGITTRIAMECSSAFMMAFDPDISYEINKHSDLVITVDKRITTVAYGTYCLGSYFDTATHVTIELVPVLCEDDDQLIRDETFGYCLFLSVLFLLITVIFYLMQPRLRDVQGCCVVLYCSTLAIGLFLMAVMKVVPYSDMTLCAIKGFATYYFIIASFLWSNALTLETSLLMSDNNRTRSQEWKYLFAYSSYAWGMSLVCTVVAVAVNYMPGDHSRPGIGLNHCWFFDDVEQWKYMYSVMTLAILVNAGVFLHTACHLWCSGRDHRVRQRAMTTVSLFIMTGLPWTLEMFGSLSTPHWIWSTFDVLNSLQGVWIFIVLVLLVIKRDGLRRTTQHFAYAVHVEEPVKIVTR